MRNMKKMISLLMVLTLSITMFTSCAKSTVKEEDTNDTTVTETEAAETEAATEEPAGLPEMTTENITLTYVHFDNATLVPYLAEKFMEKYPNITVETQYYPADAEYNNTLLNMVNNGETPDCMMILGNCDFALSNQLLGDMTEYWETDPESQNVLPTINEAKMGYYGTDKKYASPMKFFPDAIYADMAVFDKLNVEMPSTDWSWDEMINSFKAVTSPSDGIYGFNQFHSIVTYYPVAADPNCIGEFGWDGTSFHMENWAKGVNQWAELVNGKYHAPYFDTDENEAWLGDRTAWAGNSGKLGFQLDAWWTYLNLFDTDEYKAKGIEFVPYTTPVVEGSGSKNVFGVLDFGGISSGTEHPREAYELLKWMGWGSEGWKYKLEAYSTLKDEAGVDIFRQSMPLPITLDETIWDGIKAFYPSAEKENATEEDLKYGPYFDAFFEKCINVIPFGDTQIPGFVNFIAEAYAGIEDSVRIDGKNAADYAAELEEKANTYNQEAMTACFGE
ncbi:ABC transporter substrate-binding protein [Anaeromicropila populeti]|uniref:Multiple sugar transport system substrate-binding protein n=1 Tax=Anaeromicropila populeti TaxID=37658 RepID=A0A1I6LP30_9FIRM|nr:extracellular solute-binding protein [Anaeromicropila populeti]SFS05191.1 multiple sugar transport system substrate-binding protein [Anaeromicropila populeti]